MQLNGWDRALKVTADGKGLVGHAGAVLLRKAADQLGLTAGLSAALRRKDSSPLLDRGTVLVSLAAAIALGATSMSDIALLAHLAPVLGQAPSGPTVRRALELAGSPRTLDRVARARAKAREHAWSLIEKTPAGFPWLAVAGKSLVGRRIGIIDMDATLVTARSDKEGTAPTWKNSLNFCGSQGWVRVGMPSWTGCLGPVLVICSTWASLVRAPARLIWRPSTSPSHPSRRPSSIRASRLSRTSRRRWRWAGSGRSSGQRRQD
jgi:hypothetical protein